ncbi:MAG: apolipoprotein N-acyltransferase [Planctomycetes bacterium]|nr:apolipoprotein N-acyltransferase [Planctomycetota bacterium]
MRTAFMETSITAKPQPEGYAARPRMPRASTWYTLAASAGCGLLLWICFHPVALGTYLGWIALIPFFVLVRSQARPRIVYFNAFLCGLVFFVPALSWMRVADKAMIAAWLSLSAYCALYFVAALYGIRCLERCKLPLIVSAPLVWVTAEYVRCWALTGFPWYLLAHTQHDVLTMIQITDIAGVFGVSLVVVAVNAFLFDIAYQFSEVRQWFNQAELDPARTYSSVEILNRSVLADWLFRRNLILEGTALVLLLIGTYAYGVYRLGQGNFRQGPMVALLQTNLDQRLRESNDDRSLETKRDHAKKLCIRASFNQNPLPDLVIWPETSYPRPWVEISRDLPPEEMATKWKIWRDEEIRARDALSDLADTRVPHLLGMNSHFLDAKGQHLKYNSALLVDPVMQPGGLSFGRIDGKYDKIHRVPFGEYLPFKDWLPFLKYLTPYEGDFSIQAGAKHTRFQIGKHRFGVLLCYEDTDPFLARRYLEDSEQEPAVDFLVNMSNDGWFDGSSEHEEHLAVCRFRAIECRRAMVRAVNMGISAVIDSNGRIMKARRHPDLPPGETPAVWIPSVEMGQMQDLPMSQWSQFKQTAGILRATVPIDSRFSFYAAFGDWLALGCCLALLGIAGWSYRREIATRSLALLGRRQQR